MKISEFTAFLHAYIPQIIPSFYISYPSLYPKI
uniref:Uncharacterized protein n=2 Tax=unclassified Caudoviricetes TaxID=2788787 RepID=A0A8S5LSV6_9CAUD|nr:MAG TPA: hypothetical protein [Siphoviridae sp. ctRRO23]DAF64244.1 MAG TPA: hypothetical protein [Siphoviridae sp. ctKgQ2]